MRGGPSAQDWAADFGELAGGRVVAGWDEAGEGSGQCPGYWGLDLEPPGSAGVQAPAGGEQRPGRPGEGSNLSSCSDIEDADAREHGLVVTADAAG